MIPVSCISSPSAALSVKPCVVPYLGPNFTRYAKQKKQRQRRRLLRDGKCRAELLAEAPVAMAIGACILNTLIFTLPPSPEDLEAESLIDSADARSSLSISPEESWLPISSIVLCIIHVQLEASIKNGDFQEFQVLNEASRRISSVTQKKKWKNSGKDKKGES